jgi:gamma-glutamyltranspeptidase
MLVQDMQALGGLITLEDLAQYQPKARQVLRAKYQLDGHEWEVISSTAAQFRAEWR